MTARRRERPSRSDTSVSPFAAIAAAKSSAAARASATASPRSLRVHSPRCSEPELPLHAHVGTALSKLRGNLADAVERGEHDPHIGVGLVLDDVVAALVPPGV